MAIFLGLSPARGETTRRGLTTDLASGVAGADVEEAAGVAAGAGEAGTGEEGARGGGCDSFRGDRKEGSTIAGAAAVGALSLSLGLSLSFFTSLAEGDSLSDLVEADSLRVSLEGL